MLSEIFKAILITSLAGSCLAAVIAITKPITKRLFGYSWHYYIWLCVLFVMLMPVRFDVKTPQAPNIVTQTVQTKQATVSEQPKTAENIVQTDTVQKPQPMQKATFIWNRIMYNRMNILAYLWLAGMAVLLLVYTVCYIRLICKMHKNSAVVSCPELTNFTDKRVTVRVWENTSTPFMVGIFKPTLVLPDGELTEEQLDNIIRHEMTHFKRHDILYKWFAELVKCVHWFNPIVWYVSKQINTECEISCDMAVTKNMTGIEEMSYVSTILSLLPKDKSNRLSLTTQMASGKKVLKRRFTMIKNKKTTSKFMSVLSAVVAVIMLSTTVFASGVLSDMTTDDYIIELTSNGEKIELANKPFIENGEVYLPLRETLEKAVPKDEGIIDVKWNDGTIDVVVAYYQGESGMYQFKIGGGFIKLQHISYEDYINNSIEKSIVVTSMSLKQAPILKNSLTYVTLKDINYMLYGYTNRRDGDNKLFELTSTVYDKNGILISDIQNVGNTVTTSAYNNKSPEYTLEQFFKNLELSQYEQANQYCTDLSKIKDYQKDNSFAPQKIISDIKIDYTKNSFGEISAELYTEYIIKKNYPFAHWKIRLTQQDNGSYLISGWESLTDITLDENGNLISDIQNIGSAITTSAYNNKSPEYTIDQFFYSFGTGDFENMKRYCTQNCIDGFFGNDYVFGMKNATLKSIGTVSNLEERGFTNGEWAALVNVTMMPDENSVFDPNQTETSFYLILKQQNGRYLIDEFATGL